MGNSLKTAKQQTLPWQTVECLRIWHGPLGLYLGTERHNLSHDTLFPTLCHFDKCRLRRACTASF